VAETYAFELKGLTPLLMHADDVEKADAVEAWRKAPENKNLSRPGDDRSPAWSWMIGVYDDGEHISMPQDNLMVSLRQAGANIVMRRQTTFKAMTQSGLLIAEPHCEFYVGDRQVKVAELAPIRQMGFREQAESVKALGFSLFVKRAKVGTSKHIRVRARFDRWTVRGRVAVLADEITREILEQLFQIAGDRFGLCDWRPGCKTPGPWGRFEVKLKKA
jgi:hypothetical protein